MNKLGAVHSDGKLILPIGNKLSLRCMLDDWQNGSYWQKAIAYHDDTAFYMYPFKRTYLQQIQDAVNERCTELNLVIDTAGFSYLNVDLFVIDLIKTCRKLGYQDEIIIDSFNEPLEKWNLASIDSVNSLISRAIKPFYNVSLAVGDMAADFIDYYKHFSNVDYKFKYISFHTDNNCEIPILVNFYTLFNENIVFINNEHYSYNGAQEFGYDDKNVISKFKEYTELLLADINTKSVYICLPYGVKTTEINTGLFLNKIDNNTGKITTSKAWKMLKVYDIKEGVIMKLETLQKGSTNWQVRVLQSCLKINGFDCGLVDGKFGAGTEGALKLFNESHLILNNHVCSPATWYAFMIEPNSVEIMRDFISILNLL